MIPLFVCEIISFLVYVGRFPDSITDGQGGQPRESLQSLLYVAIRSSKDLKLLRLDQELISRQLPQKSLQIIPSFYDKLHILVSL